MLAHERIEQAATDEPHREALVDERTTLTYAELQEHVDRVVRSLRRRAPSNGTVAFASRKTAQMVVVMVACLRAGLTYVPIDVALPPQRRAQIFSDSGADLLVLGDDDQIPWLPTDVSATTLRMRELLEPARPREQRLSSVGGDDVAYVLYTSGSTGEPKGVVITHTNASVFIEWGIEFAGLTAGDRIALHAPLHFDISVFDVYSGLGSGATVCLVPEKTAMFPQALFRFLQEHEISLLWAVPSALVGLVQRSTLADEDLPRLRAVLYSGEEFPIPSLHRLLESLPRISSANLYGPIETNVVTAYSLDRNDLPADRVPIGWPVCDATILLLDDDRAPVLDPATPGEIAVAGPTMSPGYLNRPDLTAASRATVVLDGKTYACYLTGDYGTRDEDGLIRFLGRRDRMVKTRGFRVELGEVESVLSSHPDVSEAAVIAEPDPTHTNLLRAFVVPRPGAAPTSRSLDEWCRRVLPSYMVPREISIESDFPRTGTGKIARRALGAARER